MYAELKTVMMEINLVKQANRTMAYLSILSVAYIVMGYASIGINEEVQEVAFLVTRVLLFFFIGRAMCDLRKGIDMPLPQVVGLGVVVSLVDHVLIRIAGYYLIGEQSDALDQSDMGTVYGGVAISYFFFALPLTTLIIHLGSRCGKK